MKTLGIACLTSACLLVGCSGQSGATGSEKVASAQVPLKHLTSCADLNSLVRERTRASMNENLDALSQQVDLTNGSNCYDMNVAGSYAIPVGATSSSDDSSSASTATPTSVSQTNNQVVGVDEADLVKTDGNYLYLAQGSEFRIVSAWPAEQAHATATVDLGGTAKKLFIDGNRALVYVSIARTSANSSQWYTGTVSDCTYGYDCDFSGDGTATDLVLFDITDRAAPQLLRRLNVTGSLITARRIGSTVHTIASIGQVQIPALVTPSIPYSCSELTAEQKAAAHASIDEARAQNDAIINAANFDAGTLVRDNGRSIGSLDCTEFYQELAGDGTAITTVLSMDIQQSADPKLTNIVSRGGAVYASASSLYMSVSHQKENMQYWYSDVGSAEASTVHEFRISRNPADTAYLGSGIVPGRVLNQFSMDEYSGVLRIATTTGHVPDPNVTSTLSVLKLAGNSLNVVGQITGIAPDEDIRSVRFDGERGYLVSFKKTDPLFILDLALAENPKIVGELKIPGFSTYLHLLGSGHLLALGYEADDQGSYAYFNGVQLQVFDVINPTDPQLMYKKVYGTRGSSSSALTDHLGFTFLPDRSLLTLPLSICDGGGNGQYGTLSFSGVVALNVSVADGIKELGRLEEPYPSNDSTFYYGAACQDWWTDSNSVVARTVVLDDFLYAISANRVRVQNLTQLGTDVKIIDFPTH
jgi:uncharacterized secreted protein with C-terminal beta-propeller domain